MAAQDTKERTWPGRDHKTGEISRCTCAEKIVRVFGPGGWYHPRLVLPFCSGGWLQPELKKRSDRATNRNKKRDQIELPTGTKISLRSWLSDSGQ
jgi:hypothetical protein